MARENPRWGYLRIKGELLKLGTTVSATTIANVLRREGLGPAPRRIGPTQFLRAQALAISAAGAPSSSPEEDRGGQGQARALPARDGVDPSSLEEGWRLSEAPTAAPIRGVELGWEPPHVPRPHRPVRTRSVPLSPISGANPRDGPAAARLRLADRHDRGNPTCSRPRMLRNPGGSPGPAAPAANVRWQPTEASARSRTRWRRPIEFLYPTAEERDEPEFAASIGVIRDAFHRGARSAPLFPRLDPAEHFLGVALGREHWVEDLLHDAVSHEQGETLQQHVPAGMEGRQPKRFGEPQICVA